MSEQSQPFHTLIKTSNIMKAETGIQRAIKNRGWIAVVAEIGSGKTHYWNACTAVWRSQPTKFALVQVKGFAGTANSRVPAYMKLLLKELAPDQHVPGDVESRYELLKQCLIEAHKKGLKVILAIDEAQHLSIKSHQDLKILHEIAGIGREHLLSIIMFGKPSHNWNGILRTNEIGKRMQVVIFEQLKNEEVIEIAQRRFGLRFSGDKTKERFCSAIENKIPLEVEHFSNIIGDLPSYQETQIVSERVLLEFATYGLKIRLRFHGISQTDLAKYLQEKHPEIGRPRQQISELINGKMDPLDATAKNLTEIMNQYIQKNGKALGE